ncbi:MAG: hypothetical protein AB1458_03270 [Bacteroidota bacterium]
MLKKILLALLLVAIGVVIYLSYNKYEEVKAPVSEGFNAIPGNACFILESRQIRNTWKKLSETNIAWADLMSTRFISELNSIGTAIDSVLQRVPGAYGMLENRSLFISVHKGASGNYDHLFTFSLPDMGRRAVVDDIFSRAAAGKPIGSRPYDDAEIRNVIFPKSNRDFFWTLHKGIFSGSFSSALVEDAVRQLNSGIPLTNDKGFSKVQATAGARSEMNLFINYRYFHEYVQSFLHPSAKAGTSFFSHFASWGESDVTLKTNGLLMNGYTCASDSLHHYLGLFSGQKPQQIDITAVIPANTATLLSFGVSNFKTFHRDYKSWLDTRNRLDEYASTIQAVNQRAGGDAEDAVLSWIDNEFALVITEPAKPDFSSNAYAVLRTDRIVEAVRKLNAFSDSAAARENAKSDTVNYRGFVIKSFPFSALMGALLGDAFGCVESSCFTAVGDYIVFGKNPQSLKAFISDYGSGKTLARNSYYTEFTRDNLSDESNIYLYSNIARSPQIFKNYVAGRFVPDIEEHLPLFRKFEALGVQLSADNGMFYQNLYLKHNPIYKQETTSLWETRLDTTISGKPWLVVNHANQTKEVFVQDEAHTIYLISNTGKVLWKRAVDGRIISGIHQIDKLRNGKLQLLFNTASKIYLIDRNGRDVDGFPVTLNNPATAGIAVFDYEGSRDYRIIVPCEDKKIYNYTGNGKPADKWKFDRTDERVNAPVQHFRIGNKDYLAVLDVSGRLYITNRRGEKELKPKEKLFNAPYFFIEPGKDLAGTQITACDSSGLVRQLTLGSETEDIRFQDFACRPHFAYRDLDKDGKPDFIFACGNKLAAYKKDKSMLFMHHFDKSLSSAPEFFTFTDGSIYIGTSSAESNELYLLDSHGALYTGFPLYGNTAFSVGDMNKDSQYNLVSGSEKSVYVYSLEN